RAPSFANSSAWARPMPPPAPVMITTLPSSWPIEPPSLVARASPSAAPGDPTTERRRRFGERIRGGPRLRMRSPERDMVRANGGGVRSGSSAGGARAVRLHELDDVGGAVRDVLVAVLERDGCAHA